MSSLKSTSSSSGPTTPGQLHAVAAEEAGGRLDRLTAGLPGIVSREMARRLILEGQVTLNGTGAEPSSRVREGDQVAYSVPPPQPSQLIPEPAELDVLFEDQWLIVINKPAGVAMHPSPGHRRGTLVHHLLAHCTDLSGIAGTTRPGIVHRLDKDTSGVVVVAKNDRAHLGLSAQFRAHSVHRAYVALAVGRPQRNHGTVDEPLTRHRTQRLKRAVGAGGKHAVTHWEVLQRLGPFTLLRVRLETGRTHQIRVHMAHNGWPLLGDPLYGLGRHRGLDLSAELRTHLDGFRRQALHAAELGFTHPATAQVLEFATALPEDMQHLMQQIAADQAEQPPPVKV